MENLLVGDDIYEELEELEENDQESRNYGKIKNFSFSASS